MFELGSVSFSEGIKELIQKQVLTTSKINELIERHLKLDDDVSGYEDIKVNENVIKRGYGSIISIYQSGHKIYVHTVNALGGITHTRIYLAEEN